MKTIQLLFTLTLTFASIAAHAETVYLGGAYNPAHCSQIASSYGYPYYQYGGYVNGWYVFNACFGIRNTIPNPPPPPPPAPSCDKEEIQTLSWSLKQNAAYVGIWMGLSPSKELYGPVQPAVKRVEQMAEELEQMAKDEDSCGLISRFFWDDVRPAFEQAKAQFFPAHYKALDPKVGEAWENLEEDYRNVRSKVRD